MDSHQTDRTAVRQQVERRRLRVEEARNLSMSAKRPLPRSGFRLDDRPPRGLSEDPTRFED